MRSHPHPPSFPQGRFPLVEEKNGRHFYSMRLGFTEFGDPRGTLQCLQFMAHRWELSSAAAAGSTQNVAAFRLQSNLIKIGLILKILSI